MIVPASLTWISGAAFLAMSAFAIMQTGASMESILEANYAPLEARAAGYGINAYLARQSELRNGGIDWSRHGGKSYIRFVLAASVWEPLESSKPIIIGVPKVRKCGSFCLSQIARLTSMHGHISFSAPKGIHHLSNGPLATMIYSRN